MGDEECKYHFAELDDDHQKSGLEGGVAKVYRVASPPVPKPPVVVSRRALEDDAATIHVEGVQVNPDTGVSVVTKKVTTSLLYQVPSACGQYRLRRPTATVFAHLTPHHMNKKVPWKTSSNHYETFPLTNPSLCPSPHPSVITLSGRWTRALKFRQHTKSTPSRSETEEGSPTTTPITTIVDREVEIFHQETAHRNRTMHGATPEGVEASPMVVQHRLGVDNGVSSIDLTTFDQRFPVQGIISDRYRIVATLSNPVMILMGNHTHVTSPYHLPGGVTASALPRINTIHIYWATVEAVGRGGSSGGALAEEEDDDGGAVMGLANLDRLRLAIQRELEEQDDNDAADISTNPLQHTKKASRTSESLQMVEEAIFKQRVLLESRGQDEDVRPPCEVPHLFCGTANGDIIEHSLSNRYMHWLDRKQESLTATPATRFFKKWERRMRRAAGEDKKKVPTMKKNTAASAQVQAEREDSVETALARAQRLLLSEGGVLVEDWGNNQEDSIAAAASTSAAPGTASHAKGPSDSEDDWGNASDEDTAGGDSEGNALDLLSRPGIPCRRLYTGTVPIQDIKLSHTVATTTAFNMVALLSTSELLIFEASDPVWSVPSSTIIPIRRIYPVVPITLQPSKAGGFNSPLQATTTATRGNSDGIDTFIEQPKGPFGCIPPQRLPHTPMVPPAISNYRLVRVLGSPEDSDPSSASSCVQLNKVITNGEATELLSRLNVLGPKAFSAYHQTNESEENNGVLLKLGRSPVFTQFSLDMDGEQLVMVSPHSRVICGFSLSQMLQVSDNSSSDKGHFSPFVAEPTWLLNSTYSPTAVKSVCGGTFIVATDHELLSLGCRDLMRQSSSTLQVTTIFQTQFAKTMSQLQADVPSTHNEPQQLSHCCQVRANSGFVSPWQLQEVAGLKNNDNKSFLINDSSAALLMGAMSTVNSAGQGGNPLKNDLLIASAHGLEREITQRFGTGAMGKLCRIRGVGVGESGLPDEPELLTTLSALDGDRRDMIVGFDVDAQSERCVVSSMTSIATVPIPSAGSLKAACLEVISSAIEGVSNEIDILEMKQHFNNAFPDQKRGFSNKGKVSLNQAKVLKENLQETRFDLVTRAASCADRNVSTCPRGHKGVSLHYSSLESNVVDPTGSSEAYSALFYDTMDDYGADGGNVEKDDENSQTTENQTLKTCQISAYRASLTKVVCGGCGLDIQRATNILKIKLPFVYCSECSVSLCAGCTFVWRMGPWE